MTESLNAIVTLRALGISQMANAGGLLVLMIGAVITYSVGIINDLQRLPSLKINCLRTCRI
jgi:hypothetical protein